MSSGNELDALKHPPTPFGRADSIEAFAGLDPHAISARAYLAEYFALKVYPKTIEAENVSIGDRVWMYALYSVIIYMKSGGKLLTKANIAREMNCNAHTLTKHVANLIDVGLLCPEHGSDPRQKLLAPCDQDTVTAVFDLVRSLQESRRALEAVGGKQ